MNEEIPTHRRTIVIESFDSDESFDICASLQDERPWASGDDLVSDVHRMTLRMTIDRASLTVTDVNATMDRTPHVECTAIEPAFRSLIGISVTRGFNKEVSERVGRQRGCTHLDFLAKAIGPAVIQTMASASSRRAGLAGIGRTVSQDTGGWLRNTCHLWAEGGIGLTKIAEGWRPGVDGYPARSLVDMRSRRPSSVSSDEINENRA
jgi:hypothetical protein